MGDHRDTTERVLRGSEQSTVGIPNRVYRRYLAWVALGALIPAVLWLLAVWFQLGATTSMSHWPYDLYRFKTDILEDMPSPKLFTVSGSSGLFNIRTSTIAEHYGMAVANFSTDMELGLEYLLTKAREVSQTRRHHPAGPRIRTLRRNRAAEPGSPGLHLLPRSRLPPIAAALAAV